MEVGTHFVRGVNLAEQTSSIQTLENLNFIKVFLQHIFSPYSTAFGGSDFIALSPILTCCSSPDTLWLGSESRLLQQYHERNSGEKQNSSRVVRLLEFAVEIAFAFSCRGPGPGMMC